MYKWGKTGHTTWGCQIRTVWKQGCIFFNLPGKGGTWTWIMLGVSASVLAAVRGTHLTSLLSSRNFHCTALFKSDYIILSTVFQALPFRRWRGREARRSVCRKMSLVPEIFKHASQEKYFFGNWLRFEWKVSYFLRLLGGDRYNFL